MTKTTERNIGVIGAGAMGTGIAHVAATAGESVILFDADKSTLEKAKGNLASTLNKLSEKGKISVEEAKNIFARVKFASSLNDFNNCGLIIEAIVENLEVKQKLFSDLEKIVSDDCVLGTNTSSLSITSVASSSTKPKRVIGIHFFNPAPLMPLVEIVKGVATDSQIEKDVKARIESWGKVCVLAKDTPGFIVNRIARPYYGEAIRIYEEQIADVPTIDAAMKELGGFKMGPFELMDFIGNDVNYTVTETVWKQFFYDPKYKPSLTQKRMVEAGLLGRKVGRGYYNYEGQSAGDKGQGKDESQTSNLKSQIFLRILSMLINEAAEAFYLNIASKEDLDTAMTKGVNYPKGLLKWADEIGVEKVLAELERLYSEYSEDRYRPSVLLKKMVREKKTFY
jgi:3-hydroxybutyryl-CoA dehydrogenase